MNDTVELNYTSQGQGSDMVILHGLYGSGTNWSRHARWLAQRYRVLLPDLRNHGRSPHAPDMSYPALAHDVLALLDREGIDRALVLGHSMGGKTAMTLALQHPERVRALVVADIAPVDYGRHGHSEIIAALQGLALDELSSRQQADAALAAAIPNAMVRQFLLTNLQRQQDRFQWRIPLATLAAQLPQLGSFPELSAPYLGPTLFLYGARSDYVRAEHHERIMQLFPQAQIERIDNAGHWLHVEQPQAFAARLDEFLQEVDA